MKTRNNMIAGATLCLLLSGCSGKIELVGYGGAVPIQDGLEVSLLSNGNAGALIYMHNASNDLISVNQSSLAIKIQVLKSGQPVEPVGHNKLRRDMRPRPDDFVIIAPGQTRTIPVHVSAEGDNYSTYDSVYKIEKGILYDVEVQIDPYFGMFTKETSDKILADFKIPNYRHKTIKANTMTIRSR